MQPNLGFKAMCCNMVLSSLGFIQENHHSSEQAEDMYDITGIRVQA